jgi:hypothetical protein
LVTEVSKNYTWGWRDPRVQPTGEGGDMAISTGRGIESWHRGGFEEGLIREVRSLLDAQRREHNQEMESLMNRFNKGMVEMSRKVDAVNGFYTWLIEVYPETVAQYKALMDLQKLGEKDD